MNQKSNLIHNFLITDNSLSHLKVKETRATMDINDSPVFTVGDFPPLNDKVLVRSSLIIYIIFFVGQH